MYEVERILVDESRNEAEIVCAGSSFLITRADYERLGFSEGERLDEEIYEKLVGADSKLSCIKKAFGHLAYGDMSAKKLSDKLRARFDRDTVSEVIELLKERGYLDDSALAAKYAASFYQFKLWGPMRIKSDLFSRGFSASDAAQACEFLENEDHRENITRLMQQKFGGDRDAISAQRRKISAYLNRMGYAYGDIADVLNSYDD